MRLIIIAIQKRVNRFAMNLIYLISILQEKWLRIIQHQSGEDQVSTFESHNSLLFWIQRSLMDLRFWRSKTNSAVKNVINQAMKKDVVYIYIYTYYTQRESIQCSIYIIYKLFVFKVYTEARFATNKMGVGILDITFIHCLTSYRVT